MPPILIQPHQQIGENIVQTVREETATYVASSATYPSLWTGDNTFPITAGIQVLSASITPQFSDSSTRLVHGWHAKLSCDQVDP